MGTASADIPTDLGSRGRRRGGVLALAGIGLIVFAFWGLREDYRWVAQPFYAWVWWGYILLLDGFCVWKRKSSLLTTRRRFVLPICVWSITFWFLFELLNARMQNWYYVGVYPVEKFTAGAVFTMLAFSTVFLGIFETFDALTAAGLWSRWVRPRHSFPMHLSYRLQGIGVVAAALALLFPQYLAPLIWGSFTLIIDPWNYRRGARSLLRDLEAGDRGLIARLLFAGLICGVVWESLNFLAPQKWIYTVRGLEGLKLFEMPLPGFLGFPALALDSMAAFAFFSSFFLGKRTWECKEDLRYAPRIGPPARGRTFWISVGLQAGFWGLVAHFATPISVGSVQLELPHLGLNGEEVRKLEALGIYRPRQLLRRLARPGNGAEIRKMLGWDRAKMGQVADRAALYDFKGIGHWYGKLLEDAGIRLPRQLAGREPEQLHSELVEIARDLGVEPPRLDFVRVWVLASRSRDDALRDQTDRMSQASHCNGQESFSA